MISTTRTALRLLPLLRYAQAGHRLTEPAIARARALADAMDAELARRVIVATDGEIDVLTMGLSYVVSKLHDDPQGVIDDNLPWLLLVLDALAFVTDGGEPSDRLAEVAPGLTTR